MWILLAKLAAADPLTIEVEAGVRDVHLACGEELLLSDATTGRATLEVPALPCRISLVRPAGDVGAGAWVCAPGACTAAEGPAELLRVSVPAGVSDVLLACGDQALAYVVTDAAITVAPPPPGTCQAALVQPVGEVAAAGAWRCTEAGCAPGGPGPVVEVHLASGATALELACAGYEQRAEIVDGKARFEGVPQGECTLHFKGGAPAKFRPIGHGTWSCRIEGTVAVCSPQGR